MGCLIPIPRSAVLVMVAVYLQVNRDQKVLLQVVIIYIHLCLSEQFVCGMRDAVAGIVWG